MNSFHYFSSSSWTRSIFSVPVRELVPYFQVQSVNSFHYFSSSSWTRSIISVPVRELVPYFQFQFVNSFLALFYTAFYLQDVDRLKEVGHSRTEDSARSSYFACNHVSKGNVADPTPDPVGSGLFGSAGFGSEIFYTGSGAKENGSFVHKQAL